MYLKALIPTGLFGICSVGIYYSAMAPLSATTIDEDFYHDLNLLSRFDEKSIGYRGSIESDDIDVRTYLFNNSFNLAWKDKNSDKTTLTGNAFLLNLLIPDWMDEYHPDRSNYSPKNYVAGDEVVMLLGTSFSFAKSLFDKVTDWSKEVNCWDKDNIKPTSNCNTITLSDKSTKSNHQLLFSHPWPNPDEKTHKFNQHHSYILGDETFSHFGNEVQKPYYFAIEPKNVEAVYAAVDLSLNKRVVNLHIGSKDRLLNNLEYIHKHTPKGWQSTVSDVYRQSYKLAVDFAVIKVKFHVAQLKHKFLEQIIDTYQKKEVIPKVMDTYLEIKNDRTGAMYMGGWEAMTDQEIDQHTMQNLYVKAKECKNEPKSTPTLEIYDTYGTSLKETPTASNTYVVTEQDSQFASPSKDNTGHWFIRYKIKNKKTQLVSNNHMDLICVPTSTGTPNNSDKDLKTQREVQFLKNKQLMEFLEAKPKAHAKWKEYGVKYSYFPFQNTQTDIFNKTILRSKENPSDELNQTQTVNIFKINEQKYINIAHHLDIPNLHINKGKGLVSIMKHPNRKEKIMVGMYDGISEWTNPVSAQKRYVGKVALFISPWRYDLFNLNNHLSKPSLGDVLQKRGLGEKMIQTRRFKTK